MEKFGSQPDNDNFNNDNEQWSTPENISGSTGKHFASEQSTGDTEQPEDNVDQADADTYNYSRYSRDSGNYNAQEKAKVPLRKRLLIGAAAIALAGGIIYGVSKNNVSVETPEPTEQEQPVVNDTRISTNNNSSDESTAAETKELADYDKLTISHYLERLDADSLSNALKTNPENSAEELKDWMIRHGYDVDSCSTRRNNDSSCSVNAIGTYNIPNYDNYNGYYELTLTPDQGGQFDVKYYLIENGDINKNYYEYISTKELLDAEGAAQITISNIAQ